MRVLWVTVTEPGSPDDDVEVSVLATLARVASVRVVAAGAPRPPWLEVPGARIPVQSVDHEPRRPWWAVHHVLELVAAWPSPELRRERPREAALRRAVDRAGDEGFDLVVASGMELARVVRNAAVPAVVASCRPMTARVPPGARPAGRARAALGRAKLRVCERRWRRGATVLELDGRALVAALPHRLEPKGDRAAEAVPPASASVVVCTRDRPGQLAENLAAVHVAAAAAGAELIVVQQGSASVAAVCEELGVRACVVVDGGVGAARARNLGAARSSGDVVLFTDDDCAVAPDWVEAHLEALAGDPAVASFGGVSGLSRFRGGDDPVLHRTRRGAGTPPWLVGHSANMAVRREVLLAVGGFDERLGPGTPRQVIGEDADLIFRLLARGDVLTAVGPAVRNADWRSASGHGRNLVAYERGAGAWIGKALRVHAPDGTAHLRARVRLLRDRVAWAPGVLRSPRVVLASVVAFAEGLLIGWRLGPWPPAPCPPAEPPRSTTPRRRLRGAVDARGPR